MNMSKSILTTSQIKQKFNNEWVLLAKPSLDRLGRIRQGQVLYHSQDRDSVDQAMLKASVKDVAIYYAGDVLKDVIL